MLLSSAESVRDAALKLTQEERAWIASEILESLPSPSSVSDEELDQLLARRIEEIDSGRAVLLSSEEAWRLIEARK